MINKPTPEQERIFHFLLKRKENVLIKAYAGCGKTTTIVEAVNLLLDQLKKSNSKISITFLAFNKHIQEELKTKLPEEVRCYTTYGLGMSAIKRKYGDKIEFDEFKIDKIIQKKSKSWDLNEEFKNNDSLLKYLDSIKKLVNLCRLTLTLKPEYVPYIADKYDVNIHKPEDVKRVLKVLDEATNDIESMDYTDMIYLPAIDNTIWLFPQDYVFVDECLPGKTYISTTEGKINLYKLCSLYNENAKLPEVITYNEELKTFENKKINKVWCTGKKDVFYVVLDEKRKLRSTVNHRFLTTTGWKRLDELKFGDYVLYKAHRDNFDKSLPDDDNTKLDSMMVTSEYKFYSHENTYDMSIEDNHNFLTSNIVFDHDYSVITHNCQDLNRCQIKIIEKMLKKDKATGKLKGRLISVGDFFQNVYGFNGVDDKSFQWFEKFPNTETLPLSISFRCSKNVIKNAQKIVPDIKALDNAPDGIVREGNVLEEAENGDFVLCRSTMPLVKLFFEFLSQGKKAIIKGSDIGIHLIELIGKINNLDTLKTFWEKELSDYRNELVKSGVLNPYEHSGYISLQDKVLTLLFLSKLSNDIEDLKLKIKTIFSDKIEGVCLSTVHKIKGLEANRVFIVRPDLLPLPNARDWSYIQEKNLEYVAITRSKLELIYDHNWRDEE